MKAAADDFKGGEAERGVGDVLRESSVGGAGLLEGLKGGEAAERDLTEGGGDSLEAGREAEAELRRGARTTATVR